MAAREPPAARGLIVRLRKIARTAGAVALALIAFDIIATVATVAVGAVLLKK